MSASLLKSRVICVIAVCVSLLSCASQKPPFKVAIAAPAAFTGAVHVKLCELGAPAAAQLDPNGAGVTSACPEPGDHLVIVGTRGPSSIYIPHDAIRVVRTGDGIPIALDAELK
ncbi:MAG: hypothetical protein WA209_06980 [Candidatus Acidiferrales bacterium]